MTKTAILIPARYESTRYPGKPLIDLGGQTMIERVFERCKESGLDTYVLTDDMRIARLFDWSTCWIDQVVPFQNGTERCAGAINGELLRGYDQFINVQGDMPDVTVEMIHQVANHLKHWNVTTAFTQMPKEIQNKPDSVKMVRSGDKSLWFGRGMTGYGEWHLGIYGYKRNALQWYPTYEVSREEEVEKLEQLRIIDTSKIGISVIKEEILGVDTKEDLDRVNRLILKNE